MYYIEANGSYRFWDSSQCSCSFWNYLSMSVIVMEHPVSHIEKVQKCWIGTWLVIVQAGAFFVYEKFQYSTRFLSRNSSVHKSFYLSFFISTLSNSFNAIQRSGSHCTWNWHWNQSTVMQFAAFAVLVNL